MLAGLRVLEDSHGVAAAYCGKLLAELGADVVRIAEPLPVDQEPYLNCAKRFLDGNPSRLLELADVILTDRAGAFGGAPGLVVSITPFGLDGPYASFAPTEIVVEALGGLLYLTGVPEREPAMPCGFQASYLGGTSAAIAALAAVFGRGLAGERIEVSLVETVASVLAGAIELPQYRGVTRRRMGNQWPGSGPCSDIYPTADGFVSLAAETIPQWQSLCAWMGRPELADDPRFLTFAAQVEHADELAPIIAAWLRGKTSMQAFHEGQEFRIPIGPVQGVHELLADPQLVAIGAWQRLAGSTIRVPGFPFSGVDWVEPRPTLALPKPVPLQGVLRRWQAAGSPAAGDMPSRDSLPLAGLRVLEASLFWAGPLAARALADLGADVIKVEAGIRPDLMRFVGRHRRGGPRPWNLGGLFHELNRNKRGITLDLRLPEGRELFLDLAARCDLLIENYSHRVMQNFGLPYEEIARANPSLVVVSMPGFGDRGPYCDYVSFGEIVDGMAGTSSLTGYRGGPPLRTPIAYGDPVTGLHGAVAALAGLLARQQDGRGRRLVGSHIHSLSRYVGEEIVACQRGTPPRRWGNRHPTFVPQGVFPCRGDDRWIAVSIQDDAGWQALTATLGKNSLGRDPRFATAEGRRRHEEEIEAAVTAGTRRWDDVELMNALQELGVPAAAVLDAPRLLADPHFEARAFFQETDQPEAGRARFPGMMWRFAGRRLRIRRPAPMLGEHTDEVLRELAGLSDEQIAALRSSGVLDDHVPFEETNAPVAGGRPS